jgi:hypothetical protein
VSTGGFPTSFSTSVFGITGEAAGLFFAELPPHDFSAAGFRSGGNTTFPSLLAVGGW